MVMVNTQDLTLFKSLSPSHIQYTFGAASVRIIISAALFVQFHQKKILNGFSVIYKYFGVTFCIVTHFI